ncbi:MAG: bifunctional riboflavin kinase/FAD synthetase [Terrimonas sp.]|nr:bifunctional riboflavin kinase/FAD synthetase [Terrimonas sp.]
MQVHRDLHTLPVFRNAVVTIGTFDGVHEGHRQIIQHLKLEAEKVKGETVIITFHPHPRKIVSSTILGIRLINTLDERIRLLENAGVDHLVIVPFTAAFANLSADDYIREFLVDRFHPHTVIIGYDHRFGKDRMGDYRLLEDQAGIYGFQLREIPKHILQEVSISSTKIREAILHQEISLANLLLGYTFFFTGKVVHGNKLGRQLGFPTANLVVEDSEKIIPGDGIYAVYVELEGTGEKYKAMMSIGFRPTVDGKKRVIEVNIFDFEKEIYGQSLSVFVKQYLRAEVKYDNIEDLVIQIGKDKTASLQVL